MTNITISPNAQRAAFWVGLVVAYGLPATVAAFAELHMGQPRILLAAIVVWSIVSGVLHQISLGLVPQWSPPSAAPAAPAPVPTTTTTIITSPAPVAASDPSTSTSEAPATGGA